LKKRNGAFGLYWPSVGTIAHRIDSGTNTSARTPRIVPVKPSGATPMISRSVPLTVRRSPTTFLSPANRRCQKS
jgi:hypothetical protein